MSRRLVFLPLFVVLPALLCAQQPKLVKCRTLEAAGNFVGPDEVIVDDLVCQKAKPGAQTNMPLQAPKAPRGVVISGDTVDAAKAASKRLAAAKDAIREKAEKAGEQVTPAVPPTEPPTPVAPIETPATPAPASETGKTPEAIPPVPKQPMSLPVKPAADITASSTAQQGARSGDSASAGKRESSGATEPPMTPAAPETVSNFTNGVDKATAPETTTNLKTNESPAGVTPTSPPPQPAVAPDTPPTPSPTQPQQAATAALEPARPETSAPTQQVTPEPAAVESAASPEIVVKSAPTAEQTARASSAPTTVETMSTAGGSSAPPAASEPKPAEAEAPAGGNGFYDANAGTAVVINPRPGDAANAPPVSAEPARAPAEPRKPSEADLAAAAAARAAAEEAEASLRAPDPNLPRERVVETGAFAEPQEVTPDPAALEHKATFQPGDIEGFEEGHRAGCTKNVTIGGLKGEKLVLATPGWAGKWIEKNEKRMPQICFSDTPMTTAKNYLIVFYTAPANANGAQAVEPTTPQGAPADGVGAFTLSYGSTWHYAQERNVGVTVLTRDEADEPQADVGKVWYATAYTEEGVPVSEHWPEKVKKQIHLDEKDAKSRKAKEARAEVERAAEELLDQMVGDIAKL